MSDGGKGSSPRPFSVDADTYQANWDRIFRPAKTYTGGVKRPVIDAEHPASRTCRCPTCIDYFTQSDMEDNT